VAGCESFCATSNAHLLGARRYDIVVAATCQDCFHVIEVRGEYAVYDLDGHRFLAGLAGRFERSGRLILNLERRRQARCQTLNRLVARYRPRVMQGAT
jgi:hypothetical protein